MSALATVELTASNRFISSLSKSLQALCHGCMDFDSGIQIFGYINVSIDSGAKADFVLNEQVQKSTDNSMTFVSNSFLARKDNSVNLKDSSCSPVPELFHSSSTSSFFPPTMPHMSRHQLTHSPRKRKRVKPHDWRPSSRIIPKSYPLPPDYLDGNTSVSSSSQHIPFVNQIPTMHKIENNLDKSETQNYHVSKHSTDFIKDPKELKEEYHRSSDLDQEAVGEITDCFYPDGKTPQVYDKRNKGESDFRPVGEVENNGVQNLAHQVDKDFREHGVRNVTNPVEDSQLLEGREHLCDSESHSDKPVSGENDMNVCQSGTNVAQPYSQSETSVDTPSFECIEIDDEDDKDIQVMFENSGIELSRLHDQGYPHLPGNHLKDDNASSSHLEHDFQQPHVNFIHSPFKFKSQGAYIDGRGHLPPVSCRLCGKSFMTDSGLSKHIYTTHKGRKFVCPMCDSTFSQRSSLKKHLQSLHNQ